MRYMILALAVIVTDSALCVAQDAEAPASVTKTAPQAQLQTYVVEMSEFRLNEPLDPELKGVEIVRALAKLRNEGKVDLIESVRISAIEDHESMAHFSKLVVASTDSRSPETNDRPARPRRYGTIVKLTPKAAGDKIHLKLFYEASRADSSADNDTAGRQLPTQFNTELHVDLRMPTLVDGATTESNSVLVLVITK